MNDDVRECLEIMDKAVEFEEAGMTFYLDRGESAPSSLERDLFASLAKDEKGHKDYLLRLKAQLLKNENPEDMEPQTDPQQSSAREIFERALENASDPYDAQASELEIVQGAMEVERKGYHMYANAVSTVKSERAR